MFTGHQLSDIGSMGLPTEKGAIVKYLTNSYQGIGKKTAEEVVGAFGERVFETFESSPDLVAEVCPRRSQKLLEGWKVDVARRRMVGDGEATK